MITPNDIKEIIRGFLLGSMRVIDLVEIVDEAVSSDDVYEYPEPIMNEIMNFQDVAALYVDDEVKRSESNAFFGPDKLTELARRLYNNLEGLGVKN